MPQDIEKKHQYEHAQEERKEERAEAQADQEVNDAVLDADNHTGQQGLLPTDDEPISGGDVKKLHEMLPDFHNDELRRLSVVPPGTRLKQGATYCDLRFRESGELVAHGEEEVHDELFVAKSDVDYEIWNKLLRKPTASE
ncbi:MAG: hypothetical protein M3Y28_10700 [Armatimonadota bacterium]|nr:hypothetical protein [Armatimonadota bacterium]